MKRFASSLAIASLLTAATCFAQSNPAVGTWKLNLEKSKFSTLHAPRNLSRTVEEAEDGIKVAFEGKSADGKHIQFGFTLKYDGKDCPVIGTGQTFDADTISGKRIHDHETEIALKRSGKIVALANVTISNDGESVTVTYAAPDGKPTGDIVFYDKT